MRKPLSKTLTLPAPLREVALRRVLTAEAACTAEVEERVRASYERGRREGEQALSQQLVEQRQETQEVFQGAVKSMQDAVSQVVRETEEALVGLALEIARKLVSDLPLSVEMVEAAIQEALSQVESNSEVSVYLHPVDLELLRRTGSPLLEASPESHRPLFHSSTEVTRGGCMVRTRFGTVDARRETKFDLLKRQLVP